MKNLFASLVFTAIILVAYQFHAGAQTIFHESFDTTTTSHGFPPSGWKAVVITSSPPASGSHTDNWEQGYQGDGNYATSFSGSYGNGPTTHTGNGDAFYNSWYIYSPGEADLVTPAIDFSGIASGGEERVSFWMWTCDWFSTDEMAVYVNTSASSSGATYLGTIGFDDYNWGSSGDTGWYKYTFTIPSSFTGSSNYIIFKALPDYGWSDTYLDDVSVEQYTDCGGQPNALGITGVDTICTNANFTLTDTANIYHLGISYQWQSRPAGTTTGTWSNYATTSDPTLSTSITSSQDFRVIVTCTASGLSDTSYTKTVYTYPFYICYCKAPDSKLGGDTLNKIDSVAISSTTLHNATHTALPNSYKEFYPTTPNTTADLSIGGVYTLFAKYSVSSYGMAWLDYNRDGNLSSSEFIQINTSKAGTGSKLFTVPSTADTGLTGLRIRNSANNYPYYWYNCSNFSDGEVEDYVVRIIPQPDTDIGAIAVTTPAENSFTCANTVMNVNAQIYNFGNNPISNFYVYATYSGASSGTIYTKETTPLNPLSTITVNVGTINPPLGGNYTLKIYTVYDGDSTHANDTTFSTFNLIAPPERPVLRPDTVCPGKNAIIGVAPTSNDIHWYDVSTGGSYFYTDTTLTLYSLSSDTVFYVSTYDAVTGCESVREPLSAAVGTPPAVNLGPDATICESPTFVLDAGNPGAKYHWSTGDTTETIHVRTSGTFSVNVYHYCSTSDTISLTIKPLPSATGIDYVRAGLTYSFEPSGPMNVNSYLWMFGDGDTSTLEKPMHTYTTSTIYTVKLILYNDCGTDTVNWQIPTGINNVSGDQDVVKVYPNPAYNTVTISTVIGIEVKDVTIINSIGVVVYRGELNSNKGTININELPSGHYILRANTTKGYFSTLLEVRH